MNEVVQMLMNHRSHRKYMNETISEEVLNQITDAAQMAPSWIHGQQVSIVIVKDQNRKDRLAQLCGNQVWINDAPVYLVFCADFHRAKLSGDMEGMTVDAIEDVDALLVGATDVGLAMGNAITAAESLGIGTVPIGGIRRNGLQVVELLHLPKHVIPICGLCLGYPAEEVVQKPRLPKEAIVHKETYQHDQVTLLKNYNSTYKNYLQKAAAPQIDWTNRVATFYEKKYYQGIEEMLKVQGFRD